MVFLVKLASSASPAGWLSEGSRSLVRLLRLMTLEGDWSLSISPVKLQDEAEYQCQVLGAGGPATAIRSVSLLFKHYQSFPGQLVDLLDKIPPSSEPSNFSKWFIHLTRPDCNFPYSESSIYLKKNYLLLLMNHVQPLGPQ